MWDSPDNYNILSRLKTVVAVNTRRSLAKLPIPSLNTKSMYINKLHTKSVVSQKEALQL
jgi:hypothetical protein